MVETVDPLISFLAGIVQGVVEWLPVSSQGNLAMFLTLVGTDPAIALQLALFIQIGTTFAAALYYWEDIAEAFRALPTWRPAAAFEGANAITSFIVVACIFTGIIGIPLFFYAVDAVSELAGGYFIAGIGVLLIVTGIFELVSRSISLGAKEDPTLRDAIIVGSLQGLSILPGVSRSGITVSTMLLCNYEAPAALRFSFLLSIPASLAGGALIVLREGGLPGITPGSALIALVTAAVVGYLTIGALMKVVDRVPFWAVCFGLGVLAIGGGIMMAVWY